MADDLSHEARRVLRLSGADVREFLQGLVTNDVSGLEHGAVYAALLTPQGKYLADFFLIAEGADVLMDLPAGLADGIAKRLTLYKLRADVVITATDLGVTRGIGPLPDGAVADPRHPDMGWRLYGDGFSTPEDVARDLEARRIALAIPASGIELIVNDSYILEAGFEAFNGVDFRKGCYVGQEIVARMKHKTELRKGLRAVSVTGAVAVGTEITRDGKSVGTLFSQQDGRGIAYLRFDRVGDGMRAGEADVSLIAPSGDSEG